MTRLTQYIEAAERDNTRRSYASAIWHFEIEWKGLLPSTADAVSRYLADHAATLAMNTLRQRLAALSRWHTDQGFADPTYVDRLLKKELEEHAAEGRHRPESFVKTNLCGLLLAPDGHVKQVRIRSIWWYPVGIHVDKLGATSGITSR